MALTITEEWVRKRVQLSHDNLEDVRSLSLPGSYHEKIGSLGTALKNFARVKHIDVSRNALAGLEGLEHLKLLERLNIYFNNISSLQELHRLRHNQALQELDLRLNPVARNEPDYRLFLIHLLPALRRLDDRVVRDSERRSALMHFGSDQATELMDRKPKPAPSEKKHNPRVDMVQKMTKPSTALDDDDVEVLDLISRTSGAISQPPPITGSTAQHPGVQDYPPEAVHGMEEKAAMSSAPLNGELPTLANYRTVPSAYNNLPTSNRHYASPASHQGMLNGDFHPSPNPAAQTEMYRERYPNIPSVPSMPAPSTAAEQQQQQQQQQQHLATSAREQGRIRTTFAGADGKQTGDPNLKFQDELDAYTEYKATAHFTPHPGGGGGGTAVPPQYIYPAPPSVYPPQNLPNGMGHHPQGAPPMPSPMRQRQQRSDTVALPVDGSTEQQWGHQRSVSMPSHHNNSDFLTALLDLVDKYWNGSKSLHRNHKFQAYAKKLISQRLEVHNSGLESDVGQLQDELDRFTMENSQLKERLSATNQEAAGEETRLKASLSQANKDVDILQQRLQHVIEENRVLQQHLKMAGNSQNEPIGGSTADSVYSDGLLKENEDLRKDLNQLSIRLKQYAQMQELATMLQESHKSLVTTNDHLLKELDETRARHQHEVQQLHWSYDQLKKTVDYLPNNTSDLTSSSRCNGL